MLHNFRKTIGSVLISMLFVVCMYILKRILEDLTVPGVLDSIFIILIKGFIPILGIYIIYNILLDIIKIVKNH